MTPAQVYRARLAKEGREVAVKVQRPGVAELIAQDVYILRELGVWVRRWRKLNTDLPALLDDWGGSLFRWVWRGGGREGAEPVGAGGEAACAGGLAGGRRLGCLSARGGVAAATSARARVTASSRGGRRQAMHTC
jgi:hypothetical protein